MRTLVNCILLITILSANAQSPRLWGMTGAFNQIEFGTIFSINLDGSDHQIEYVFSQSSGYQARGALCLAPNGKLYGMTSQGGIYGNGTLFSFDPSTQQFNKILDCDYGAIGPSWVTLLLASDGYLYGAGASNIFRLDPATDEYTFHAGYSTNEGFMQTPDGLIYGSETYGGFNGAFGPGLIYRFDPVTLQVEELHAFSEQDGAQPYA